MSDASTPQVADRYTLLDLLGSGGAGAVWRARDELLHRLVAVKEVRLLAGDPDSARDRVLREARATARLNHPSITSVYDVIPGEGSVHIVMELVAGGTLTERVRAGGPLDPDEAAEVGLALLAALEAAHRQGIVHRDVKPSNVLLPGKGEPPKLTDFGIASVADDMTLTATGAVLGSPSFIAPEQATGSSAGPPADLWGLGALLYFAVEGVAPFDRGEPLPTRTAVVNEPPRPTEKAGALGPLIGQLLSKDPEDRPDTEAVRSALLAIRGERTDSTTPLGAERTQVLAPVAAPPAARAAVPPDPGREGTRPSRALPLVVGIVALIGLLALAGWASTRETPDVAAPEPTPDVVETPTEQPTPVDTPEATEEPEAPTEPDSEPTEPEPTEPTEAATEEVGELPDDWGEFQIGPAGAAVAHPAGWQQRRVSDTITDLRDPASSTYLRTDWTASPAGDPVADWERQSASFGQRHSDYSELRIEPMQVDGHDAAIWEYTYSSGGARLRAVNIGIVGGDHGYALNFQTREDDWDAWQSTLDTIVDSFSAP
jgi:eukaryotic-like serine/threonine-protein kinase